MNHKDIVDGYLEEVEGDSIVEVPALGAQCVALVADYNEECFDHVKTYSVKGAKNYWYYYDSVPSLQKDFIKVAPYDLQYGDIVVWDWGVNDSDNILYWGHVAIYLRPVPEAGEYAFEVMQQNGGTDKDGDGSADGVAHKNVFSSFRNVLGGLRPRLMIESSQEAAEEDEEYEEVVEPTPEPETPASKPQQAETSQKVDKDVPKIDLEALAMTTGQALAAEADDWLKAKKSKLHDEGVRVSKKFGFSTVLNTGAHALVLDLEKSWPVFEKYDWLLTLAATGGVWGIYWLIGRLADTVYLKVKEAVEDDQPLRWGWVVVQRALGCKKRATQKARATGDWRFYDKIYS